MITHDMILLSWEVTLWHTDNQELNNYSLTHQRLQFA